MVAQDVSKEFTSILNVREVVKLDLAAHGTPFILAEFALTSIVFWPLAAVMIYAGFFHGRHAASTGLGGFFFLMCALNASTLLFLALHILKRKEDVRATNFDPRRYVTLSLVIGLLCIVPLVLPTLAVYQAVSRQTKDC